MDYFSDLTFVTSGCADQSLLRYENRCFEGYYGLQFLFAGEMEARTEDHDWEIATAPVAFITFPGVRWSYGNHGEEPRGQMWICFRGKRVEKMLQGGLITLRDRDLFLPVRNAEAFRHKMEEAIRLLSDDRTPASHARAVLILEGLLLALAVPPDDESVAAEMRYGAAIRQLQAKLEEAPTHFWDFEKEAQKLSLSYSHFRKVFRKVVHCAPGQYLLECRLRKAEQLLTATDLRSGEISAQCGFEDPVQFCRNFRKHTGMSPKEYRRIFGPFG